MPAVLKVNPSLAKCCLARHAEDAFGHLLNDVALRILPEAVCADAVGQGCLLATCGRRSHPPARCQPEGVFRDILVDTAAKDVHGLAENILYRGG